MSDDWCDFGELPASSCACDHCRPDLAPPPPTKREVIASAQAYYPGRCDCGRRIERGDLVVKLERGGRWLCAECGGQA